ncbi:UNVERIFIED_CONTAM: hypothetical protein NCL1_26935 [Trichonephila clavipes]
MDCEARVSRYWLKSCRWGGNAPEGCVPTDPNHTNGYCDPLNISSLAPKKWHIVFISLKQFEDLTNSLTYNREKTSNRRYCNILREFILSFRDLTKSLISSFPCDIYILISGITRLSKPIFKKN